MNAVTAMALVNKAEEVGVDASFYESYSGRGMFGKQTAGVVISQKDKLIQLALLICMDLEDEQRKEQLVKDLSDLRSDNMGRDMIFY